MTETNLSGCSASDSVTIKVNALPKPIAGTNDSICFGGSKLIGYTGTTGSTYVWSNGVKTSSLTVSPSITTTYKLTETNVSGCSASDSVTIKVNALPLSFGRKDTSICAGLSVLIGVKGSVGSKYSWSSGDTNATVLVTPTSNISYILTEKNSSGCIATDTVNVTIKALPNAKWTVNTFNNRTYQFNAADSTLKPSAYSWSLGDGFTDSTYKSIHTYAKDTTYFVSLTVSGANGCISKYDSSIKVITGIENYLTINNFNLGIYPNPFRDLVTLTYNLPNRSHLRISLTDMNGKDLYMALDETQNQGSYKLIIDNTQVSQLPAGIYILKFQIGNQIITKQLMKFN